MYPTGTEHNWSSYAYMKAARGWRFPGLTHQTLCLSVQALIYSDMPNFHAVKWSDGWGVTHSDRRYEPGPGSGACGGQNRQAGDGA